MTRINKKILIFTLAVLVCTFSGRYVYVEAVCDDVIQEIESITNKEFGKIRVTNKTQLGIKLLGGKIILLEDDKYEYEVDSDTNNIVGIISKELNHDIDNSGINIKRNQLISNESLINKANHIINKYSKANYGCKYILVEQGETRYEERVDKGFVFKEVLNEGLNTGRKIAVTLSENGEFISLSQYEGNIDIAMNEKPRIDEKEAIKIAIKNTSSELDMPITSYEIKNEELDVFEDKLVWVIELENIIREEIKYGYIYYIDAKNGDILYLDNYGTIIEDNIK